MRLIMTFPTSMSLYMVLTHPLSTLSSRSLSPLLSSAFTSHQLLFPHPPPSLHHVPAPQFLSYLTHTATHTQIYTQPHTQIYTQPHKHIYTHTNLKLKSTCKRKIWHLSFWVCLILLNITIITAASLFLPMWGFHSSLGLNNVAQIHNEIYLHTELSDGHQITHEVELKFTLTQGFTDP